MKTKLPRSTTTPSSTKGNNSLSWIRKSIYSALVFFGTLIVLSVVYAAYQTITSTEYAPWATLTSSLMTKIVGNVEDLNWRMNNAVPATSLTGTINAANLPFRKGQIVGSGSAPLSDATTNSNTSYYHVEQLQANRNLISSSVHWGIDNSEVGTMNIGVDVNGWNGIKSVTIPAGYYDGTKKVTVNDSNLVAGNIASGVSVLGVSGNSSKSSGFYMYQVSTGGCGAMPDNCFRANPYTWNCSCPSGSTPNSISGVWTNNVCWNNSFYLCQ